MASPFLAALGGFANSSGLIPGIVNGITAYNTQDSLNTFMNALTQARAGGVDPRTAFVNTITANPQMFFDLPENVRNDTGALIKMMMPPAEQALQGPNGEVMGATTDPATGQLQVRQIIGQQQKPDEILQRIKQYEAQYGPLSPDQRLRMVHALESAPSTSVKVDVGAPNLGPIFDFMTAQQGGNREDQISALTLAKKPIDDLVNLTNSPEADNLFGLRGKAFEATAPFASAMGLKKSGFFFGPDVSTIGDAQNKIASALIAGANWVRAQNMNHQGRLLSQDMDQQMAALANPQSAYTSKEQVRAAAQNIQRAMDFVAQRLGMEVRAGGVFAPAGTDYNTTKELARQYLTDKGIDPDTATPEQAQEAVRAAVKRLNVTSPAQPKGQPKKDLDAVSPPPDIKKAPPKPAAQPNPAAAAPKPDYSMKTFTDPNDPELKKLPSGTAFYAVGPDGKKTVRYVP